MADNPENVVIATLRIRVPSSLKEIFIDWQTKLNSSIAGFPGFVSLEILSPVDDQQNWAIIQRFSTSAWLSHWKQSDTRQELIEELKHLLKDKFALIQEIDSKPSQLQGGVTEVFVTQVAPGMENAYREWIAKIHQAEAKFPGFRGAYIQSPSQNQGQNWITLLQFDTLEHLDNWLSSRERAEVLSESSSLISSLESHRILSPYVGWFASIANKGEIPPTWKQTMIILLVLFPIVMLELKYLVLLTGNLNISLATFIGNAISVTLIAWPIMPIAIALLGWWLSPKRLQRRQATILGTGLILLLYFIEIAIFWYF